MPGPSAIPTVHLFGFKPTLTKMATIRLFKQAMSVLSGMKDVPLNATTANAANPAHKPPFPYHFYSLFLCIDGVLDKRTGGTEGCQGCNMIPIVVLDA